MFSVIVPVYNVENYLDRCVESVIGQTCRNWEIILVEDSSQDNSWKKCICWNEKDKRIKIVKQNHSGASVARNRGIGMAEGEYLLFLDSDDWWDLGLLKACENAILSYKADLMLFDTKYYRFSGCSVPKRILLAEGEAVNPDTAPEVICRTTSLTNKCFKKSLFIENDIKYPVQLLEEDDVILPLLMSKARRIVQLRGVFYHYDRTNNASITTNLEMGKIRNAKDILIASLQSMEHMLEESGLLKKYRKYYGRYALLKGKPMISYSGKDILGEIISMKYPEIAFSVKTRILVFGSYNLRSAVNFMVLDIDWTVKSSIN